MPWRQVVSDITPKVENKISAGNIITIMTGLIALVSTVYVVQADLKALAQRVDKGESRDDETAKTLGAVKESIIELKGDNKSIKSEQERQGRQIEEVLRILRSQPQPNNQTPR